MICFVSRQRGSGFESDAADTPGASAALQANKVRPGSINPGGFVFDCFLIKKQQRD
jgi:hypothetical protein